MKCFVCGGEMKPYFKKKIAARYLQNLDALEYVRCEHCGMVVSKTLYEMSREELSKFIYNDHKDYFSSTSRQEEVDPRWLQRLDLQAALFAELLRYGVFDYGWRTIDYGAGNGLLANKVNALLTLHKYGSRSMAQEVWLKKYDEYMEPLDENYLTSEEVTESSFDFLVSSSVFEHLFGNRGEVEKVIGLLKPDGIMALHTLICEEVPQDPEWYYLVPVHCTLWTNKAMQIVYQKSGFIGCGYNVEARMWIFFRNADAWNKLKACRDSLSGTWVLSEDFVDYWKCKPYRK